MKKLMLILGVIILLCSYGLAKEVPVTNSVKPPSSSEEQKSVDKAPVAGKLRAGSAGKSQKTAGQPNKQDKDNFISWLTLTLLLLPALTGLGIALFIERNDYKKVHSRNTIDPYENRSAIPLRLCQWVNLDSDICGICLLQNL